MDGERKPVSVTDSAPLRVCLSSESASAFPRVGRQRGGSVPKGEVRVCELGCGGAEGQGGDDRGGEDFGEWDSGLAVWGGDGCDAGSGGKWREIRVYHVGS